MAMRSLFDQYNHPENRLTHALLSTLANDRQLLNRFVRWTCGRNIKASRAEIREQSLAGDPPDLDEEEAERRGLPDGCISTDDGWALLIESKIEAPVSTDQLRRHARTARRRGLGNCSVLLLIVNDPARRVPSFVLPLRWSRLYAWLAREAKHSRWARSCCEYIEVVDARLTEGTLTMFSGVPFGPGDPYTYLQAKRVLGLLRDELRRDGRLIRRLGADPESPGRGAITGRAADFVWDFIGLRDAPRSVFTQYPHLTLGVHADRVDAYVTIPNGIRSRLRTKLLGSGSSVFEGLVLGVTSALVRVLRRHKGSSPMIVLVQRHYPSQRAQAVPDCVLRFDPRTALPRNSRLRGPVKFQPQWLDATYHALKKRRSNLQLQIGAQFPYASCRVVHTPAIVEAVAEVWLACKPIVRAATD